MKKIICLWGGPGTGKSTTAAGLFSKLKSLGFNAEMNREYVKAWVWEKREILPGDQVYITAKQARAEVIYMRNNLDFIVTDSPLALTSFYGDIYDPFEKLGGACKAIIAQHHKICQFYGYKIEHILLKRQKAYNPAGRLQDESTAKSFDSRIKSFLKEYPIKYTEVLCDDLVVEKILSII